MMTQSQARVRLESAAIIILFERIDSGQLQQIASEMVLIEIDASPDPGRRRRMLASLPPEKRIIGLSAQILERAAECESMGFKAADAVHVAAAEASQADVLLSCDDRMCRTAR